jgi:threonine/homoserine/homoserine lactone efflux protein
LLLPIHDFPLFVAAGILLNMTPGPDTAFILSRSAAGGARAGVAAALGIGAGCFFHTALAALGLSALLVASETAFTVVKYMGALYLAWMGIGMIRSKGEAASAETGGGSVSPKAAFWQGVLTNALNPKVALFFLAFMPQFIVGGGENAGLAFVVLGLTFATTGTLWNVGMGWLAGRAVRSFIGRGVRLWLERVLGVAFVGFGVGLALARRG